MDNFYALQTLQSTEVDCRTWLHVPSGTLWSTSSDTHQVVETEGICKQVPRSTSVESKHFESIFCAKIDWNCKLKFVGLLHHPMWLTLVSALFGHLFSILFFVWLRSLTRIQYPKCAHGLYCELNPNQNCVYIWVEVSFYIKRGLSLRLICCLTSHSIIFQLY